MAIKHSKLTAAQSAANGGFTDHWCIHKGDFIKNATTAHVLDALDPGDVVYQVLLEAKQLVAGPTATVSVGIVGTLTLFTAAADVTAAATAYTAAIAAVTPYPRVSTSVNLVANAVISNVDLTAGEVHIWAKISRVNERCPMGDA